MDLFPLKRSQPSSHSLCGWCLAGVRFGIDFGCVYLARFHLTFVKAYRLCGLLISDSLNQFCFTLETLGRLGCEVIAKSKITRNEGAAIFPHTVPSSFAVSATNVRAKSMFLWRVAALLCVPVAVLAAPSDALFQAVVKNDPAAIRQAVADGANINAADNDQHTPLFVAVNANHLDAIKTLLSLGAEPNCNPSAYEGPCLFVAIGRDTEIVKVLIAAGADVNLATKFSISPLERAVQLGEKYYQGLRKRGEYKGPLPNRLETVRLLIKAGANINYVDVYEHSPLRVAMTNNNLDVANLLFEAGANVNQRIRESEGSAVEGNTILMDSIAGYPVSKDISLTKIKMLLDHGAEANDKNRLPYDADCEQTTCFWAGHTALTFAVKEGSYEVVDMLLKYGADPSLPRQDGRSALALAEQKNNAKMVQLLRQYLNKPVGKNK